MNYLERARELTGELVAYRRRLHGIAETGFDLDETCRVVWEALEEMGVSPAVCGRSGITALIGRPDAERVILLRADMDALPMREESGMDFASGGAGAHTCGHDLHTAILLGAARMLGEREAELNGAVKLMFQPAEETLEGAKSMIAAGVLENPRVDAAIALHVAPEFPCGQVLYNSGVVTASSDLVHIDIQGKGGHGALPAGSIDPIVAGCHLVVGLQTLISRELEADQAGVLTFGVFQAGSAGNIIPDRAALRGTLRTFDNGVRETLRARITEFTAHSLRAMRCTGEVSFPASTCAMEVDAALVERVVPALHELIGERARRTDIRSAASEDFAEIAARVPAMFFDLGAGGEKEPYPLPVHHPAVLFNEDCLSFGAAALAQAATAWLAG